MRSAQHSMATMCCLHFCCQLPCLTYSWPTSFHSWHITSPSLLSGLVSWPISFTQRPIFGRPYYRSCLWYTVSSVCLSVTFCIVAKRYVLDKNCLKERIGNQGQKVDFLVAAIFLLPVSPLRPPRRPFLPYFCPYSQAIGTRW